MSEASPYEVIGGAREERTSSPKLLDCVTEKVGQAIAGTVENSVDIVGAACETVGQVFVQRKCDQL